MTVASLYVIDDHPLVCEGLNVILSRAGHVVEGSAGAIPAALTDPALARADLIVLDLSLGDDESDDSSQYPRLAATGKPILVYSMHEQRRWIDLAFAAGATGYVAKRDPPEHLLAAIGDVLSGNCYVSPKVAAALIAKDPADSDATEWGTLTDRELEAVWALSRGETTEETARRLFISQRTVEAYYARIINKLHLGGTKELRRRAIHAAVDRRLPFTPPRPRRGNP